MDPTVKRVSPAALLALKDALYQIYWYKNDLKSFLFNVIQEPRILGGINWDDVKRNVASQIVDRLAQTQPQNQSLLVRLMMEVSSLDDFSHLARLDNGGPEKAKAAQAAVKALKNYTKAHQDLFEEEHAAERRRATAASQQNHNTALQSRLQEIRAEYLGLIIDPNHQGRGYKLEKIMFEICEVFDLDPKASFRITGEQIDGAFLFDGTDYLFEAKWDKDPIGAEALYTLEGKLSRRLDNTLGLFLSINGFSMDGIIAHSAGKKYVLLMDGADLNAVLEARISFPDMLRKKKQYAARTGRIFLPIAEILG